MSTKLVTVVGATGVQGSSVIDALLSDAGYSVRALTRNTSSAAAKALAARGIEVVQADVNDLSSLTPALKGSYAVYALTDFFEPFGKHGARKAVEIESAQGINLAKAAASTAGLQHYIWSTLPDGSKVGSGRYSVPHIESKNIVDAYIRSQPELLAKTTFFWVTFYAQNYYFPMFTPIHVPTAGKHVQLGVAAADVPITTIGDARSNIGPFALAALNRPDETRGGKAVLASAEVTTVGGMLQTWARAQGKTAEYVQVGEDTYHKVWPMWAEEMSVMMRLWEELREQSWSSGGDVEVLDGEALGVTGLKGLEATFSELKF